MITGDQVVVINAKDVVMVGDGWLRTPVVWGTPYPGGKYRIRLSDMFERDPCLVLWYYIRLELNKNYNKRLKMRMAPIEKAYVYEDAVHPHHDKNPRPVSWNDTLIRGHRYQNLAHQQRWYPNDFMK